MKLSLPISHLRSPIVSRRVKTEHRPGVPFTHHVSRFTFHAPRPTPHAPRSTHTQRGVALVITLVLLSIITFMAVTFLVVSRSQHGSVATETDLAIARLAADSATERAKI